MMQAVPGKRKGIRLTVRLASAAAGLAGVAGLMVIPVGGASAVMVHPPSTTTTEGPGHSCGHHGQGNGSGEDHHPGKCATGFDNGNWDR